jgi:hypothetical protein
VLAAGSTFSDVQGTFANFITANSSGLTGELFPSLIRVTGTLTAAEMTNVAKISVFFDAANFFVSSVDSRNIELVGCSSNINGASQVCQGYYGSGDNSQGIHAFNRVDFDFTQGNALAADIQLLIPVSTIIGKGYASGFVASLINDSTLAGKPYLTIQGMQSAYFRVASPPLVNISSQINKTYYSLKLDEPAQPLVGQLVPFLF